LTIISLSKSTLSATLLTLITSCKLLLATDSTVANGFNPSEPLFKSSEVFVGPSMFITLPIELTCTEPVPKILIVSFGASALTIRYLLLLM
jgi:hypothetical protein